MTKPHNLLLSQQNDDKLLVKRCVYWLWVLRNKVLMKVNVWHAQQFTRINAIFYEV